MDENVKKRLLQGVQSANKKQQNGLGSSINEFIYRVGKVVGITTLYAGSWLSLLVTSLTMLFLAWPGILGGVFFVFVFAGAMIEGMFSLEKETVTPLLALIGGGIGFFAGMGIAFAAIEDEWGKFQKKTDITWFIIYSWLEFVGIALAMIFLAWPFISGSILVAFIFAGAMIEGMFNLEKETVVPLLALVGGGIGFFAGMGIMMATIENKWKELQDKRWK